jgi:predicted Zn-dependent protease
MRPRNRTSDGPFRSRFEEAIRLRDDGLLEEADSILLDLERQEPSNPAVSLVRAGILFGMNDFDGARVLFSRIVGSKPTSELASRGLFHSLWKLGRHDEAFAEMKRFLQIAESKEYRRLLSEIIAETPQVDNEQPP